MRALTLTQPWASLVAIGAKRIETRSWQTSYRGPLAIHAGKGMTVADADLCYQQPFKASLNLAGFNSAYDLPRGQIIAVVKLAGCFRFTRSTTYSVPIGAAFRAADGRLVCEDERTVVLDDREAAFGDFTPGRYGFLLDGVRMLAEPIPCRGSLGLWETPESVGALLPDMRRWPATPGVGKWG